MYYLAIKNVSNNAPEMVVGPLTQFQMHEVKDAFNNHEDYIVNECDVMTYEHWKQEVDTTPKLVVKGKFLKFLVDLNYTSDDWQLYTSKEGCKSATVEMNNELEYCLAEGAETWLELYRSCHNVLARHRDFGSCDTEPRGVLVDLLRELGMPEGVV